MKNKYGSAVLTALQAQKKDIDEVGKLTQERRLKAFKEGKSSEEWLSAFWRTIEILEANKCRKKNYLKNSQM